MKDQRIAGKRTNNPVAKQLSDSSWRKRVVTSKVIYNRKKEKEEGHASGDDKVDVRGLSPVEFVPGVEGHDGGEETQGPHPEKKRSVLAGPKGGQLVKEGQRPVGIRRDVLDLKSVGGEQVGETERRQGREKGSESKGSSSAHDVPEVVPDYTPDKKDDGTEG